MSTGIYIVALVVCAAHVHGETSSNCNSTLHGGGCVLTGNTNVTDTSETKQQFDIISNAREKGPPKIQRTAKEIVVTRKRSVDISCKVTGVPRPEIRWFFKHISAPDFAEINEKSDAIHIPAADLDSAGTYRCEAYNSYGVDTKDIDLIVEYPPTIKDDRKIIKAVEGTYVYLHCTVDGFPPPHVYWTLDGVILGDSYRQTVLRNNTLRLVATISKAGAYVCEAANRLGSAKKTVQVVVYVPPKIKTPMETTITRDAYTFLVLHCDVSGNPKPDVTWLFFNSDTKKEWRAKDNPGVLYLPRLRTWDSGHYMCVATNWGGSVNVTFSVDILAPPNIRKPYKPKSLKAFVGDIFVELPCLAIGNPKPTVTWSKDGVDLHSGKDWHHIRDDGTLVIKYVEETANGTYKCVARNEKGYDKDEIDVIATQFPKQRAARTVYLEFDEPAKLKCDASHKKTDVVRWYKDTKILTIGELSFDRVKVSDRGLYTCRVFSFFYDVNSTISLRIGYRPMFLSAVHQDLEFQLGGRAYLPCVARGHPYPKVIWQHNSKTINQTNMVHSFKMAEEHIGQYKCVVSNVLGSITRNFTIFKNKGNIESTTKITEED